MLVIFNYLRKFQITHITAKMYCKQITRMRRQKFHYPLEKPFKDKAYIESNILHYLAWPLTVFQLQ